MLAVSTSVFNRGRVERFAHMVETGGNHHMRSRSTSDLAELVAIGRRLAEVEFTVEADPEFRTGLRAMLMATIERDGIGATAHDPEETRRLPLARHRKVPADTARRRWAGTVRRPIALPRSRRARAAVVVGLAVGTVAISGMSAASGNAMPGDPLYGMKRGTERAQLALAGSDVSRGQLSLAFAKTRMNEAQSLRAEPNRMATVLADMDNETRTAVRLLTGAAVSRHDPAALDVLDRFTAVQRQALTALKADLPGAAQGTVQPSLALLDQVHLRSVGLRATLGCDNLADSRVDELGPVPNHCSVQSPNAPRPAGGSGTPEPAGRGGAVPDGRPGAPNTPAPAEAGSPSTPAGSRNSDNGGLIGDLGHLIGGLFG
jgi:hypothetical protein